MTVGVATGTSMYVHRVVYAIIERTPAAFRAASSWSMPNQSTHSATRDVLSPSCSHSAVTPRQITRHLRSLRSPSWKSGAPRGAPKPGRSHHE